MSTKVTPDGGVMRTCQTEPILKKLKSVFAGGEQHTTTAIYARIIEVMKTGKPMIVIINDTQSFQDDHPELNDYPNAKVYFLGNIRAAADQLVATSRAIDKAAKANPSITTPWVVFAVNAPEVLHFVDGKIDFKATSVSYVASCADEVFVTMRTESSKETT